MRNHPCSSSLALRGMVAVLIVPALVGLAPALGVPDGDGDPKARAAARKAAIENPVEKDPRVQAEGKRWRLDKAQVSDPARPRVLLIGDSILNGYLDHAVRRLQGTAHVDAWVNPYCQSESYSSLLVDVLQQNGPYDVIHFNIGLHGIQQDRVVKGQPGKHPRIPEDQFEPLTKSFVEAIKRENPKAKIIWANTTPVSLRDKLEELDPALNPIVIEHNRMAAKVMAEMKVPVNDFYGLLITHPELKQNDFHWKGGANRILGDACVESVLEVLPARSQSTDAVASPKP